MLMPCQSFRNQTIIELAYALQMLYAIQTSCFLAYAICSIYYNSKLETLISQSEHSRTGGKDSLFTT